MTTNILLENISQDQSELLSQNDKLGVMEIISQCHFDSEHVLDDLPEKLSRLIPYEMFAYGHGRTRDLYIYHYVNFSFPENFLELVMDKKVLNCGMVKNWVQTLKPIYLSPENTGNKPAIHKQRQDRWMNSLKDYEINNIACHGMVDGTGNHASTFFFADFFERWSKRTEAILTILTPHLHHALIQPHELADRHKTEGQFSTREHEVLYWMAQGKSNWEIGIILGISESTVRIHVQKILEKLVARNRAHAVAIAMQRGYLSL